MKKIYHRLSAILLAVIIFTICTLLGGAWYLLNYALKPEDRARKEQLAWTDMFETYPNMKAWHDSLVANNALHDTTIINNEGLKLHAWYVKAPSKTNATALLVHGYTDCGIRMMPLGRMYNHNLKMNILLPDLQNAGQSDGDHFQMGWFDRNDVKQWATVCNKLFGDSVKIVVHGISMGAATTMMMSGDENVSPNVKAYIEDCGYTNVEEQFEKELKERFNLPSWPLIPLASQLCKWRYGWSFAEASAIKQVRKCNKPMLFIHGTADKFVPTNMVFPLYKAKQGMKSLWLVPHAEHARSYFKNPRAYETHVVQFLQSIHFYNIK